MEASRWILMLVMTIICTTEKAMSLTKYRTPAVNIAGTSASPTHNSTYYIQLQRGLNKYNQNLIRQVLKLLQNATCLHFQYDSTPPAFARVLEFLGHNAKFERRFGGKHPAFRHEHNCYPTKTKPMENRLTTGIIVKECRSKALPQAVLVAIGYAPEHKRMDRIFHVQFVPETIDSDDDRYMVDDTLDLTLTNYDMSSILHPDTFLRLNAASSRPKGDIRMLPLNALLTDFWGGEDGDHYLSFLDKKGLIKDLCQDQFQCQGRCENGGFFNKNCLCECPDLFKGKHCETLRTDECGGMVRLSMQGRKTLTIKNPGVSVKHCVWVISTDDLSSLSYGLGFYKQRTPLDAQLKIYAAGPEVQVVPVLPQTDTGEKRAWEHSLIIANSTLAVEWTNQRSIDGIAWELLVERTCYGDLQVAEKCPEEPKKSCYECQTNLNSNDCLIHNETWLEAECPLSSYCYIEASFEDNAYMSAERGCRAACSTGCSETECLFCCMDELCNEHRHNDMMQKLRQLIGYETCRSSAGGIRATMAICLLVLRFLF